MFILIKEKRDRKKGVEKSEKRGSKLTRVYRTLQKRDHIFRDDPCQNVKPIQKNLY